MKAYKKRIILYSIASVIIVAMLYVTGALPTNFFDSGSSNPVLNALEEYFEEHQRYPTDLDVLVEQYGVDRDELKTYSYFPTDCYGSYWMSSRSYNEVTGEIKASGHFGEPGRRGREAKLRSLREHFRRFHSKNHYFPRDLKEFARKYVKNYEREVVAENFSYSVSGDQQSFTIDGRTFGPAVKNPDKSKAIRSLEVSLLGYEGEYEKLPEDLQDLIDARPRDRSTSHNLRLRESFQKELEEAVHFLKENNFQYSISEDGNTAYLNGEDIQCIDADE